VEKVMHQTRRVVRVSIFQINTKLQILCRKYFPSICKN